jgi:RNA polymerase sigma factor (TIGR02999 family)
MEPELTKLVRRWQAGDEKAADELFVHTFQLMRQRAAQQLRHEPSSIDLQPTELVSEGAMRLLQHIPAEIADRHHFVKIAACAMRQALAEHGRRAGAEKRPKAGDRRELASDLAHLTRAPDSLIDLDRAIARLAGLDQRQANIARLHLLAELTIQECAEALNLPFSTARRSWRGAKIWLRRELSAYFNGH